MFGLMVKSQTNAPIVQRWGQVHRGESAERSCVTAGEVIVAGRACGFFARVGQFWLSGNRRFLVFR